MADNRMNKNPPGGTAGRKTSSAQSRRAAQPSPVLVTRRQSGANPGSTAASRNAGNSRTSQRAAGTGTARNTTGTQTARRAGTARNTTGMQTARRAGTARSTTGTRTSRGSAGNTAAAKKRAPGRRVNTREEQRLAEQRAARIRRQKEKERRERQLRRRTILAAVVVLVLVFFGVRAGWSALHGKKDVQETASSSVSAVSEETASADGTEEEPEEETYTAQNKIPTIENLSAAGLAVSDAEAARVKEMLTREEYPESLIRMYGYQPESRQYVVDYKKRQEEKLSVDLTDEVTKGKIPLFVQWDERWGYEVYGDDFLGLTGCGPTCISMVYSGLSGKTDKDPWTVASMADEQGYYVDGVGSSWEIMTRFAEQLGLESEEAGYSEEKILEELKAGHPFIAAVGPGDFTVTGHFIVLAGVDSDGMIKVCDPNSYVQSQKTWDLTVLLNQSRDLWCFRYVAY